jgi:hypothetical protein
MIFRASGRNKTMFWVQNDIPDVGNGGLSEGFEK